MGVRGKDVLEAESYPPGKLSAVNTFPAEFQVPGERELGGDMELGRRSIQPKPIY